MESVALPGWSLDCALRCTFTVLDGRLGCWLYILVLTLVLTNVVLRLWD